MKSLCVFREGNRSIPPVIGGLILLILIRILLQMILYKSGFISLTADEYSRTLIAGHWSKAAYTAWHGLWLPFHTYLFGTALRIRWDLLWTPRLVVIFMGALSIIFMYLLTSALFEKRRTGIISAILLSVNPAHLWLSSTALTEMPQTMLILGFMWFFTLYLKTNKKHFLYGGAVILALANGFRFESWIISLLFSITLLGKGIKQFLQKDTNIRLLFNQGMAAIIPWVFPLAWLIGNYMETGNPLYFLETIRAYKKTWYGQNASYLKYLETFVKTDPYTTILGLGGVIVCILRRRKSGAVAWYTAMMVFPLLIFIFLHRGQLEPSGNYIRYLALYVFLFYPAVGHLISTGIVRAAKTSKAGINWLILVLSIMVATQMCLCFNYKRGETEKGMAVGQRIRELREQNHNIRERPVLIELSYWQFLAIRVGTNDISLIMYDRELDERRESESLLLTDIDLFRENIRRNNISYIIVKSPQLREIVEKDLKLQPAEEVNSYVFYPLANKLIDGSYE
ncbi:MAG: hypothetical protein AMJ79_14305 [Phycisphaerae bacterium SM23_30]|nr:MAG: hypothetical protein AMJ79_14305 [Phycisphaerae bacterium SM23_30]